MLRLAGSGAARSAWTRAVQARRSPPTRRWPPGWSASGNHGRFSLVDVVRHFKPTVLDRRVRPARVPSPRTSSWRCSRVARGPSSLAVLESDEQSRSASRGSVAVDQRRRRRRHGKPFRARPRERRELLNRPGQQRVRLSRHRRWVRASSGAPDSGRSVFGGCPRGRRVHEQSTSPARRSIRRYPAFAMSRATSPSPSVARLSTKAPRRRSPIRKSRTGSSAQCGNRTISSIVRCSRPSRRASALRIAKA